MVARKKVARTRLTEDEYDRFEARAAAAGFPTPAEYLRDLIVGQPDTKDLLSRVTAIESRLEHVESEVARMWLTEGKDEDQVSRS